MAGTFIQRYQLRNLPRIGKLFVALFTAEMVLVCLWAVGIYFVSKGMITWGEVPQYSYDAAPQEPSRPIDITLAEKARQNEIDAIEADSESVLAPIWDSSLAGIDASADSGTMAVMFRLADSIDAQPETAAGATQRPRPPRLTHNVGLAHTHMNGQTLLFFAVGLVFLFTGAPARVKRICYWAFGVAIVAHTIGLTGQGFYPLFDDFLAISGVTILVVILYMALLIFADLAKKPLSAESG